MNRIPYACQAARDPNAGLRLRPTFDEKVQFRPVASRNRPVGLRHVRIQATVIVSILSSSSIVRFRYGWSPMVRVSLKGSALFPNSAPLADCSGFLRSLPPSAGASL